MFPRRAEHNHSPSGVFRTDGFDSCKKGFRFHDHSGAAAVWRIVNGPVPVRRKISEIMDLHINKPIPDSSFHNALIEIGMKDIRENSDYIAFHNRTFVWIF